MRAPRFHHHPAWARLRRRLLAGLSLALLLPLAAACGARGGATPSAAGSSSQAVNLSGSTKAGGSITVADTGLVSKWDPIALLPFDFAGVSEMNAIYGLLSYDKPGTSTLVLSFLKSITPDADHKVWTLTLTPGLKFSDGTPLNAAAIAFNMKRAADPTLGSLFVTDAKNLSTQVIDATTLKVTLKQPNAHFDALVAEEFPWVASPTAVQKWGSKYGSHPVGAGPFKVKSIDGTNQMVVERNPYYSLFAKDEPRLDTVTFQSLPDFSKQAQALGAGQAQMAMPYGGTAIQTFRDLPNVEALSYATGGGSNLEMSLKRAPFNDPLAREALTLALNRTAVAAAFHPGDTPQTNLFPKTSPYYSAQYDYPQTDHAKAQALFNQLAAAGKPVTFAYTTVDSAQALICAQVVQSELAAYKNVKMTIKSESIAQYITDGSTGNFQIVPNGLYLVNPMPELKNFAETGGSLNPMGYSNPKVDTAIKDLLTQGDTQKQVADYGVIQQQMLSDYAVYWAGNGLLATVFTSNLTGIVPIDYGNSILWGTVGYKAS